MDPEKLDEIICRQASENKLSCQSAHKIATETGCSLSEIGEACNRLKIKIITCQLGLF